MSQSSKLSTLNFFTSHVTVKLTSNRRRWTHIFPKGPSGHHQQTHVQQVGQEPGTESRDSPSGARNSPVRSACSGHGASTPAKAISEATLKRISDIAVNTVGMERVGVRRQHKALGENKQAVGKQ